MPDSWDRRPGGWRLARRGNLYFWVFLSRLSLGELDRMLVALSQFGFLFCVAAANLWIGFALGQLFRGKSLPLPLLLLSLKLPRIDCRSAGLAHELEEPPTEHLKPPRSLPTEKDLQPTDSVVQPQTSSSENTVVVIESAIVACIESLSAIQNELQSDDSPMPDSVRFAAHQVDEQTQQLLQRINTVSDNLGSDSHAPKTGAAPSDSRNNESPPDILAALREQLDDSLVQLVVLSFHPDTLDETVQQLVALIEATAEGCRTAREKLNTARHESCQMLPT